MPIEKLLKMNVFRFVNMSSSLLEKIIQAVREKQGFDFAYWVRSGQAGDQFVRIYQGEFGDDNTIAINNAKNLGYAFAAFIYYSEELPLKDYIVFLTNIVTKQ